MPVELTPYTKRPSALESRVWTASHMFGFRPVFLSVIATIFPLIRLVDEMT